MKKLHLLRKVLLLCALVAGSGSVWAVEETIASFTASTYYGGTTNSWTVSSDAEYATSGKGHYKLITNSAYIATPSINWSNYEDITITISARKFNGPNDTQGKISVSQGETELTSYSPSGTSIVASSALTISPTGTGSLTIACLGASDSKGCSVQTITIKGTMVAGKTDPNITFYNGSVRVGKSLDLNTLFESNSTGTVTYSITSGDSFASLVGSTLTGVAVGSVTVKAEQASAGAYNAGEGTATITVQEALTLNSIAITTTPTKTVYEEGETFDATGMVVTATYSDSSTDDVTASCTWSPDGALTTSDTEVIVSYTENGTTKTATQAITVTEVVDYVTLPFSWSGGTSAALKAVTGMSGTSLGSDYAASHGDYRVKFGSAGSRITIKTNGQPGKVVFKVKLASGALSKTTITVKSSANGTSWADLESLKIDGKSNDILTLETTKSFAATDRYVQLYYNREDGTNIGVGPIDIYMCINDAADYTPVAKTEANVTLDRKFVAGWNGIVLPFDLTTDVKTAMGATDVRTLGSATETAGAITLSFEEATLPVAAGTPVMVKLSAALDNLSVEGVDLKTTAVGTVEKTAAGNTFTLAGTYSSQALTAEEAYFVSNTTFYHKKAGDALTAKPFRAYITQTATSGARMNVNFDLEGETTGVSDAVRLTGNGAMTKDKAFYNLNGQRVNQPTRGLYIVNGKKVTIK